MKKSATGECCILMIQIRKLVTSSIIKYTENSIIKRTKEMETSTKVNNSGHKKSHVGDAASELLNEGKKLANELYEDGLHKVSEAEASIKEYSDDLLVKVQKNPLTSILIAGGIGFLLSSLLKK